MKKDKNFKGGTFSLKFGQIIDHIRPKKLGAQ